jgi:hypothetical protein
VVLLFSFGIASHLPPKLFCSFPPMAICAPNFAFRDLIADASPTVSATRHNTYIMAFYAANMIELQYYGIRLATIDARSCAYVGRYLATISPNGRCELRNAPEVMLFLILRVVRSTIDPHTHQTIRTRSPVPDSPFRKFKIRFG